MEHFFEGSAPQIFFGKLTQKRRLQFVSLLIRVNENYVYVLMMEISAIRAVNDWVLKL